MIARLSLILKFKEEFFEYLKSTKKVENRFFKHRFPRLIMSGMEKLLKMLNWRIIFSERICYDSTGLLEKRDSVLVSAILGITRQIVDRNYNYLNFFTLRNLDATICFYLQENY